MTSVTRPRLIRRSPVRRSRSRSPVRPDDNDHKRRSRSRSRSPSALSSSDNSTPKLSIKAARPKYFLLWKLEVTNNASAAFLIESKQHTFENMAKAAQLCYKWPSRQDMLLVDNASTGQRAQVPFMLTCVALKSAKSRAAVFDFDVQCYSARKDSLTLVKNGRLDPFYFFQDPHDECPRPITADDCALAKSFA
jgi:hypothetical protein